MPLPIQLWEGVKHRRALPDSCLNWRRSTLAPTPDAGAATRNDPPSSPRLGRRPATPCSSRQGNLSGFPDLSGSLPVQRRQSRFENASPPCKYPPNSLSQCLRRVHTRLRGAPVISRGRRGFQVSWGRAEIRRLSRGSRGRQTALVAKTTNCPHAVGGFVSEFSRRQKRPKTKFILGRASRIRPSGSSGPTLPEPTDSAGT
jgi:hypothetical protein